MYISASISENSGDNIVVGIKGKIDAIKQKLESQKNKVQVIATNLPSSNNNYRSSVEQLITNLQVRIFEKEQQLSNLRQELEAKDRKIASLTYSYEKEVKELDNVNKKREAAITNMEDAKNVAYFITGTRYELQKKGVIDQKGGFIGIGKWPVVSGNADYSVLKKVDMRNMKEIPLTGRSITIVTPHNTSSYTLEGNPSAPTAIKITNPELFWKTTHCLVIMTN
jgi:anaerobic glycerol-3-phosphate dehydrogenase